MIDYAVYPTQRLMDIIKNKYQQYENTLLKVWVEETIWNVVEKNNIPIEKREEFYAPRVKIIMLADIINQYKVPIREYYKNIIEDCFGDPVEFNLETFDMLWTVKRINSTYDLGRLIINLKAEYFQQITKTNNDVLDKWLFDEIIKIKLKYESFEEDSPQKKEMLRSLEIMFLDQKFWDWKN